jgi:hypothetical protein
MSLFEDAQARQEVEHLHRLALDDLPLLVEERF